MKYLIILLALSSITGSSHFQGYDRTYSVNYTDPEGHNIGGSVRLSPAKGYAK